MGGPAIDRANSSGDIWTPWEFIDAVQATFCRTLTVDLAASGPLSTKAPIYITPETDSLTQDWVDAFT